MLVATSGISWWALGYQLSATTQAIGDGGNTFVGTADGGTTSAFLKSVPKTGTNLVGWFFGFAFAATAATIVSGAVAERTHFRAYIGYSAVLTGDFIDNPFCVYRCFRIDIIRVVAGPNSAHIASQSRRARRS